MKGLLVKDFIMLKKSWKTLVLITAGISAVIIWQGGGIGLVSFFPIMLMMQGITSVITDKMNGWNETVTNFPLSRADAVREKYLFSILLFLLAFPVALAASWLLDGDGTGLLCSSLIGIMFSFSALAVGLPLLGRMQRSNFFIGIFVSFIPAALMVAYWSQCISVTMTIGEEYVVDMAMDVLGWFAAGSVAAALLSMLVMPMVLARYDLN